MKGRKLPHIILLAAACGVLLAFAYINPYNGNISLSELALQLSGARGMIQMGVSLTDLLSFGARLLPCFLFELYVGTSLYGYFCTASVYIFTRTTNRLRWYLKESLFIAFAALLFQCVLAAAAIAVSAARYNLTLSPQGWQLLGLHILVYTLWLFAMTLLINVLALKAGSEMAFAAAVGGQCVCITLLAALEALEGSAAYSVLLDLNPVSHLVIGWHDVGIAANGDFPLSISAQLSMPLTLAYLLLIAAAIAVIGGVQVCRHDLIVADAEFGGA